MIPQPRPYQSLALDDIVARILRGERRILVVSPTGCHRVGQPILMHDGTTVPVETVKVGDRLMGPDSTPRTVLQLCRGRAPMFRVVPVKGEPFVVNGEHVLSLVRTNDGDRPGGEIVDVSVSDYLGWSAWRKHVHKLFRVGVDFPGAAVLPIDPYFLGVLLGDGRIAGHVSVSKPDPEILAECEKQAALFGLRVRTEFRATDTGSCPTHYLQREQGAGVGGRGNRTNPLLNRLRLLGMDAIADDRRFIPPQYKLASAHHRRELLAGMIDTDGHVVRGGCDWISKSSTLAADFAFVARSLGFAAYITPCEKRDQNGGGGTYHRVYVSGDLSTLPIRIPRKRASVRTQKKDVLRTGFRIDPLAGTEPFYGFTLDGDGRYLLGDFTVTHNSGKTVVFAEIIRRMRIKGKTALVIAGARELIFQASEKLSAIDVDHGVLMAGIRPRHSDVQVGSIQTITRRGVLPPADIVIIDEADLARAAMYEAILLNYANSVILGFTASPWRGDGKGLGGHVKIGESMVPMFQTSIVMATPRELMQQGYLVPVDLENSFFFARPDTSEIKVTGGDYDDKALKSWAASSSGKKIAGDVIAEYVRRGDGKRAICFAASVDQSQELTRLFVAAGVAAEHVDGTTDRATRAAIFGRVRSGATRVLCNVGVVTRGVDIPPLEIAIMVRPTKSVSLYLQMLGRPMRPAPGKTHMRILDHAGNFEQDGFGMPDADRDYSLSADLVKAKKKGDVTPLLKKCPQCFRAWTQDPCWHCGYKPPVQAVKFDEKAVAVSLAEVVKKPRPERGDKVPPGPERDAMVAELRRLRAQSRERNWKPKAVEAAFNRRFGFWPHWDLMREAEREAVRV